MTVVLFLLLLMSKFMFVACRSLDVFLDYSYIILPFYIQLTLRLPPYASLHRVEVTGHCCMAMPSFSNTLIPAWWAHLPSSMWLVLLCAISYCSKSVVFLLTTCFSLYLKQMPSHDDLTCYFFSLCCSIWAVWQLHAHWLTNWLLMWACKKTPQVAMN